MGIEQVGDPFIDVFRAVVSVEAEHGEREGFQQLFQGGNEVALADFLDAKNNFELSDFIDGIDVVNASVFAQIPLMYSVNANIARVLHEGFGF